MRDEDGLQEEVLEGLIKGLKMPLPSLQNLSSKKEIFFPAHMIAMCVSEMWHAGNIAESERLLFTVMDTIQKQCLVCWISLKMQFNHSNPYTFIELYW